MTIALVLCMFWWQTLESQGSTCTFTPKVLNRLGVCASADTLARFVLSKAEKSNWLTITGYYTHY